MLKLFWFLYIIMADIQYFKTDKVIVDLILWEFVSERSCVHISVVSAGISYWPYMTVLCLHICSVSQHFLLAVHDGSLLTHVLYLLAFSPGRTWRFSAHTCVVSAGISSWPYVTVLCLHMCCICRRYLLEEHDGSLLTHVLYLPAFPSGCTRRISAHTCGVFAGISSWPYMTVLCSHMCCICRHFLAPGLMYRCVSRMSAVIYAL